ncbi:hypothetical protein SRHO_G00247960 [Serrasalmus rhombeus]
MSGSPTITGLDHRTAHMDDTTHGQPCKKQQQQRPALLEQQNPRIKPYDHAGVTKPSGDRLGPGRDAIWSVLPLN